MIGTRSDNAREKRGMVLGCMTILQRSGMTKEEALPVYQKLLEYHGLTAESMNKDLAGALACLPTAEVARAHLFEVCPELQGEI